MPNESEANCVFCARVLWDRYPAIYDTIHSACVNRGIDFNNIRNTRNIWARDFMPMPVGDKFIKFIYKRPAIYSQLDVSNKAYDWLPNLQYSKIALDGGNIVRYGEKTVITDMVFRDNQECDRVKLISKLEKLLNSQVIVIPSEPGDTLGHSDGILHFINSHAVFVNDYNGDKKHATYKEKLLRVLYESGLTVELLPWAFNKRPRMTLKKFRRLFPHADEYNPATGYYINFLAVGKLVMLPVFGIEEDAAAITIVGRAFPNSAIVPIDCGELAMEGGCINCITWDAKAQHGSKSGNVGIDT